MKYKVGDIVKFRYLDTAMKDVYVWSRIDFIEVRGDTVYYFCRFDSKNWLAEHLSRDGYMALTDDKILE